MENQVLVTGGTGFLGIHIIYQLLQKGYRVRTTVRSLSGKDKVIETLENNGITDFDSLSFIEADLSKDDNWDKAMEGCKYVLSVASPVFFEIPDHEAEMIRPAVDGIIRVLKAADKAGVKRVVMTSNFGAVGFSNKNVKIATTEEDWTNPDEKGLSVYEKSKLLAEQAAWNFIKNESRNLEFATINPVAIFGPSLSSHISGSFSLLDGSMKVLPDLELNIVDVRDVADLHIRAMTSPKANGQRFIASADGKISMREIETLLKSKRPDFAKKVSIKLLPNSVIKLAALLNKQAKEGAFMLGINRNVSNAKAKTVLNWVPIATNEEIILSSVDCMIKFGFLKEDF